MKSAAQSFLDSLDPDQRAKAAYPFETDERFRWQYTPGPRAGLALVDMTERQRGLAMRLLDSGLSRSGAETARQIMALEPILRAVEQGSGRRGWERRDQCFYWFSVFGDPTGTQPWAWRLGGHHLCLHFTVVDDRIAVTPLFFGANPARVPSGELAALRVLAPEEDLARSLVNSLRTPERQVAIIASSAPADILTRNEVRAEIAAVPTGIHLDQLQPSQQDALATLVEVYTRRVDGPPFVLPSELTFAWAGSTAPGEGHYYAIRSETLLIEYDNTQDGANHIHTVWRDLRRDWGEDLLAHHYRAEHTTAE
jgi:hypothetical protein